MSAELESGALFRRYARAVGRYLCGLGVRLQDRDDMVQEVFLIAHRHGVFQDRGVKPFTWLADIAFRIACAEGRRRRRLGEAFDPGAFDDLDACEPTAAEMMEAAETRGRVQAALAAMENDKRSILLRFELGGHDCETIARDLGVPIGTVYSRLHHARGALAKLLDPPAAVPNSPRLGSTNSSHRRRRRKVTSSGVACREPPSAVTSANARHDPSGGAPSGRELHP